MFHPDSSYYQRLVDHVVGRDHHTTTASTSGLQSNEPLGGTSILAAGRVCDAASEYGRTATASRFNSPDGCSAPTDSRARPKPPKQRHIRTMEEQQLEHEQQRARLETAVGELMEGKISNKELMEIAQATVDSAPSSVLSEAVGCRIETPVPPVRIGHGIYPDPEYTMVDFATLKAQEMEERYCKRAVRHAAMLQYQTGACAEDYFLVLEQLVINGHSSLLKRQLRRYRNADGTPRVPEHASDRHMAYATNRFMSARIYLLMTVLCNVIETFTSLRKSHDKIQERDATTNADAPETDTTTAEHTPLPGFLYSLNGMHILMYCLTMVVSGCVAKCERYQRPSDDPDQTGGKRVLTATCWKKSWKQHCFTTSSSGKRDECPCPSTMCVVCEREFNLTKRHDRIYGPGSSVPSSDPWPTVVELVYPLAPGGDVSGNSVKLAWLPFCSVCATGVAAYSEVFHSVQTGVVRLQKAIAEHHERTKTTLSHKSITELLANERFRISMRGVSASPVAKSIATVRACYAAFMGSIVPAVLVHPLRRIMGDPYGTEQADVRYETITEFDGRCLVSIATAGGAEPPDATIGPSEPIGFRTTLPRGVSSTQLVELFENITLTCFFEPLPLLPHGVDLDDSGENARRVTKYVATRARCIQRGLRKVLAMCAISPRAVVRPKRPRPRPPTEPIEVFDDPLSSAATTESREQHGRKRRKLADDDEAGGDDTKSAVMVVTERDEPAPIVVV